MPTVTTNRRIPWIVINDLWGACAGNGTGVSSGYFSTTSSVTKPDSRPRKVYLQLCRNHVYRGTSMNGTVENVEHSPSTFYTSTKDLQCSLPGGKVRNAQSYGYLCKIASNEEPNDPTTLDLTVATNQARASFNDNLRSTQTSLQGLVCAGEAGETLRMIQDRGRKLARKTEDAVDRYYYRMMRDRFLRRLPLGKRVAKAIDTVSGIWLEEVFGWAPLVSDLDSAAKALAKLKNDSRWRYQIVSATGRSEQQLSLGTWKTYTSAQNSVQYRIQHVGLTSVRYTGEVQVAPASARPLRQLGVSLRDVVPSIWECIPYSFLVDYFVNVGDVINGWSSWSDELIWCEYGSVQEYVSQVVGVSWASTPTNLISRRMSPGNTRWSRKSFNRRRENYAAIVRLQFRIPGIGSTKWCNMTALAAKTRRCRDAMRRLLT